MQRAAWARVRRLSAAGILALVVWRVGAGPFLDGVRRLSPGVLLAAAAITAVTTVCSAWRWRTVVRGLGGHLPLRTAVAACYRSQFLNCALPGGVIGDVHRGVRHGLGEGDVGRGLRAVVWERLAGQAVLLTLAPAVLLLPVSPARGVIGRFAPLAVAVVLCALLLVPALSRCAPSSWARALRAGRTDVRDGLLARRAWPVVGVCSLVVVAGHAGTFLVAAAATGTAESPARLVPLAVLVLLATGVPLSLGGWGPREGAAAWAFGAAGLGAAQGVAAATAFGVLTFVATLPGAVVLGREWLRGRTAGRPSPARSVEAAA
jgi:glycosyltransferase 2 family protein